MRCLRVAPAWRAAAAAAAALTIATGARPARADATDLVARPLGLLRGQLDAQLVAEVSLRPLAEPFSLAPDLWYGAAPRFTIGLVHSARSLGLIDDGATLCFRGRPPLGCARAYRGSGVDARFHLREGPLAVAPRARLLLRDIDPAKPAITVGALVRWTRGRFAVTGDPYLRLGLASRDLGNRAALVVPVWLAVQPTCRWLVALHTGWDGELAILDDGWHIPIGLGAEVRVFGRLHVAVEAGFRSLLGPQHDLKTRTLALALAWRPT
ncbi:MAG TPA: hypothetical protein VNO30_49430 [Kofleriaceae bacterium]|nr:hypothetical protein [Kofleriaceae bacterium]